jgi:starch synthase (maltosyl-transferring)
MDLKADEGRRRVVIENIAPAVDAGQFSIKRIVGQTVRVTADVFADGHDVVRVVLQSRPNANAPWNETPMTSSGNDGWQTELTLDKVGQWQYTICGWVDAFDTWHRDLKRRLEAGQDVSVDLVIGSKLVSQAADRARGDDAAALRRWTDALAAGSKGLPAYHAGANELDDLMRRWPDRRFATTHDPPLSVTVDRQRAEFSTWYELFPRSCSAEEGRHGTFRDVEAWLPRLSKMGFDVIYVPPVHPIGDTFRKGANNAISAEPGEVGSPWAIGSAAGGHRAILKELGTLADLRRLIATAAEHGIELALDIAFQCSPDHPYVKEHPAWFRKRPDGTVQYAENPPKKYQDIVPFDFESSDWRALWDELTGVVLYWCEQGIRIFRVDNPHTKPFAFWQYLIGTVKGQYPDALFLSEAFTRPKIMYRLAKLGFTQSYTYFTWRNGKAELTEYFTELTQTPVREFFRPNLWPNTPDILPEHLQTGGRAAFVARLVMAATLGSNYGIYGPAFETLTHEPREPGSEEYLDSEKYQLKHWNLDAPGNLHETLAAINRARRENPALQSDAGLRFHATDNEQLLCYSKHTEDGSNLVVVVVNLTFHELQRGFIDLSLSGLNMSFDRAYAVQDLLTGSRFDWQGPRNFVELDPSQTPAHVFRVLPQP